MKRLLSAVLVILSSLLLSSCTEEDRVYDAPVIVSPIDGQTYYPDQLISLKWIVPDSTQVTRIQELGSRESDYFDNEEILFDTLTDYWDYSNQSKYEYYMYSDLPIKLYYAFRLKYIANDGSSKWSPIVHYNVFPFSELDVVPLEIRITFKFLTEHSGEDYSGLTKSLNSINIDSIILANGYDLTKLKFIKPGSGSINDYGIYADHFGGFAFGVREVDGDVFPFDPLGSASGGFSTNEILFSPIGGIYRDLYQDFGRGRSKVLLAYSLSNNRPFIEEVGIEHDIEMILVVKCYFEK